MKQERTAVPQKALLASAPLRTVFPGRASAAGLQTDNRLRPKTGRRACRGELPGVVRGAAVQGRPRQALALERVPTAPGPTEAETDCPRECYVSTQS